MLELQCFVKTVYCNIVPLLWYPSTLKKIGVHERTDYYVIWPGRKMYSVSWWSLQNFW